MVIIEYFLDKCILGFLRKTIMGIYFTPNNGSFRSDKKSMIYIDITGLINYLNGVWGTKSRYIALVQIRFVWQWTDAILRKFASDINKKGDIPK